MSTTITETEVVASPLRRVRVGTQQLKVARSPTLRFLFFHSAFVGKMAAGDLLDADIADYVDEIVALLQRYNPKVDEVKLKDECELTDLLGFYGSWFGSDAADEGEVGEGRPPRRRGTAGPKRTGSKSRSST